jgi:hypothetical protein
LEYFFRHFLEIAKEVSPDIIKKYNLLPTLKSQKQQNAETILGSYFFDVVQSHIGYEAMEELAEPKCLSKMMEHL